MADAPVRILLAEDNSSDAELILAALSKDGLASSVHVARDGVEALDFLLRRGPFAHRPADAALQLILLDVKLPRVDGFQVLEEVRRHPRTRFIPVVMLTSSNIERDVARGYQLGANSYLQKPLDFDRFRETVRTLGVYWLTMNERPPQRAPEESR